MDTKQQILITDKSRAEINRVICVRSLDSSGILVDTVPGLISLEGHDLKIENLDKESASIIVIGEIDGVYYLKKREKRKGRVSFL